MEPHNPRLGRDDACAPFQWSSKEKADFCDDCKMWNSKDEPKREDSSKYSLCY